MISNFSSSLKNKFSVILIVLGHTQLVSNVVLARDYRNVVEGKAGKLQYSMTGVVTKSGSETSFSAEWQYYLSKVNGIYLGYRSATDSVTSRTLYQASYIGGRIFPTTNGVPVESIVKNSVISYDFRLKPYLDSGISLGRYLIQTAGNPAVFDASSNFFGLSVGGGVIIGIGGNFASDFSFLYEINRGYNSPLAFNATTVHINIGVIDYL